MCKDDDGFEPEFESSTEAKIICTQCDVDCYQALLIEKK